MKVVIFAGGLGTRISEETDIRPKPMVEIGGKPIIWHIMKIYEYYGFNEFIVCLGYKGYVIKEYFMNYFLHNSDFTINLADNKVVFHNSNSEKFEVTLRSITGKIIYKFSTYKSSFSISKNNLSEGIYILELMSHNKSYYQKIIIQ